MTDHPELHGVIRLEDQGSDALRKLAGEIHKVSAAAGHAGRSINHMEHEGALAALREHAKVVTEGFNRIGESVLKVHERVLDLVPAFAALSAGATFAGALELVNSEAEKMEGLEHASSVIGLSVRQLQSLHFAASVTATSAETLDKSMERLNKTIAQAAHGQNKAAAAVFRQAHIQLYANHHLRNAADILPELADGFSHTADAGDRANVATLLMGKGAQEALPFFALGAEKIRELNAEFDHLHPAGNEGHQALLEYADGMKRVSAAADGFKESLAESLAPLLLPAQHEFAEFLANQSRLALKHEGIGGFIEREGKKVKEFVDGINWRNVEADLDGFANSANRVADAMGGWGRAAEVLAALMAAKSVLFLAGPIIEAGNLALKLAGWIRVGEAAAGAAAAERAATAVTAGGGVAAAAAAGTAAPGLLAARQAAANPGRLSGVGQLLFGLNLLNSYENTKGDTAEPQDFYYQHPDVLKTAIAHGFTRAALERLPRHAPLDQLAADTFGEDSLYRPLFGGDNQDHNPFRTNKALVDSLFAGPSEPGLGSAPKGPFSVSIPRLEGDITLHLNIPGLPPGTTVTATGHGSLLDMLNQVDVGNYGNSH